MSLNEFLGSVLPETCVANGGISRQLDGEANMQTNNLSGTGTSVKDAPGGFEALCSTVKNAVKFAFRACISDMVILPATKMKQLESVASVFAIGGSVWLSQNVGTSPWGWCLFLISSLLWIAYSWKAKMNAMMVQSIVFTLSNINGIWHCVVPLLFR